MITTSGYIFFLQLSLCLSQIYLSPSSGCGAGCTGSMSKPYPSIVGALTSLGYFSGSYGGGVFILMDGVYSGSQNTLITLNAIAMTFTSLNGQTVTIIDCLNQNFGFNLLNGKYHFNSLTIQNCTKPAVGGSITASNAGGALYASSAEFYLLNMIFINNSADYGGACAIYQGSSNINGSIFANNTGFIQGGGFYQNLANVLFDQNVIWYNQAGVSGGGIYVCSGTSIIYSSNITNNSKTGGISEVGCLLNKIQMDVPSITTFDIECNQCAYSKGTQCLCPHQVYVGSDCVFCDSTCNTCSGSSSNQCTSCLFSGAIVLGSSGPCICPQGQYNNSLACSACDASCLSCNGGAANNCLSCPTGASLQNDGTCRLNCLSNQYYNNNIKTCSPCASSCLTCNGGGTNNCLSCKIGYSLKNDGTCNLDICYSSQYFDFSLNLCMNCDVTCITCSGGQSNNCLSCGSGNVLTNNQCVSVLNYIKLNNLTNESGTTTNNNNTIDIFVFVMEVRRNYQYQVMFSSYWQDFFNSIENCTHIIITNFTSFSFKVSHYDSNSNLNIYEISIIYQNPSFFPPNTFIYITFNTSKLTSSSDTKYKLMNTSFIFSLDNMLFQEDSDFELAYTEELNVIQLSIESFLHEINDSTIQIDTFELQSDYIYNIETISPLIFNIHLYNFKPMIGGKHLHVTPPGFNEAKSIRLFDLFLDPDVLATMKTLAQQANVFEILSKIMMLILLSQGGNSGGVVHNMMLIELIFILKYIDLDYPPNLNQFFISRSKKKKNYLYDKKFMPNKEDSGQIPPLFELFEITPYFLDYTLDLLLQNAFFYICGLIILYLPFEKIQSFHKILGKYSKILKVAYTSLKNIFIWEYVLVIYLTNFQEILFKTFIPIKFPTISSSLGVLNLIIAVIIFTLNFIILVYLAKIRANLKRTEEGTIENIDPIFEKKEEPYEKKTLDDDPTKRYSKETDCGFKLSNFNKKNKAKNDFDIQDKSKYTQSGKSLVPTNDENLKKNLNEVIKKQPSIENVLMKENKLMEEEKKTIFKEKSTQSKIELEKYQISSHNKVLRENSLIFEPKVIKFPFFEENTEHLTEQNSNNIVIQKNAIAMSKSHSVGQISLPRSSKKSETSMEERTETQQEVKKREKSPSVFSKIKNTRKIAVFEENFETEKEEQTNLKKIAIFEDNTRRILNEIESPKKDRSPDIPLNNTTESKTVKKIFEKHKIKEKYAILFEEYKNDNLFQRFFIFVDLIRQSLIILVMICMFPQSYLQMKVIVIIQTIFLIASFSIKPMKTKFGALSFVISESFLTTAFLSCLIIAIYNDKGNYDEEQRRRLGYVVPYCNLGLLYWVFLTILFKVIMKVRSNFKKTKKVHNMISEE